MRWRPARESNPSHFMDSEAASPDASQALARLLNGNDASGPGRTDTGCALSAFPLPVGVQTRKDETRGPGWIQTNAGLRPAA
jgi:hypothetical protein